MILSRSQANASSRCTDQRRKGNRSCTCRRKESERLLQARERLGLAHRGVVAGGVLDGLVVGRDGADPGRERRPVQEEALVLLFGRLRPVELALGEVLLQVRTEPIE